MSGFVGVVHFDGRPPNRALLEAMTASMSFRGPDGCGTWIGDGAALGGSRLRLDAPAVEDRQPLVIEDAVAVGDVRLDRRAELVAALQLDRETAASASDLELAARAYRAWGDSCLARLFGDFSFAIWDVRQRRLFSACDQVGIKPFFYAPIAGGLVFGNTLDAIRMHAEVSSALDETAVGDFLLFGWRQDPTATSFAGARRLPGAHRLVYTAGGLTAERYWRIEPRPELRYRRDEEYVEQFRELLRAGVADRMGNGAVAVSMSGGLDSTSIAAAAKSLVRGDGANRIKAVCQVHDGLFNDPEREFASTAAQSLGIALEYVDRGSMRLFEAWSDPHFNTPEPVSNPLLPAGDILRAESNFSRRCLTGFDGDTLLAANLAAHFRRLVRAGRLGRFFADAAMFARRERMPPPLGFRTFFLRRRQSADEFADYPRWLNPDFEQRCGLRERWRIGRRRFVGAEQVHAPIFGIFNHPIWPAFLDNMDPAYTKLPLHYQFPFLDLRLVEFCMRLPPVPWLLRKHVLRASMRGILPDAILDRAKTPMAGDPLTLIAERDGLPHFQSFSEGAEYVLDESVQHPQVLGVSVDRAWTNLRPVTLSLWVARLRKK